MCCLKVACLSRSAGSLANTTMTTIGMLMAKAAIPYTAVQPKACASGGAISTDTAVPTLPAPTRPMARPLWRAGKEPEPSDNATPKLAPAMPSSTPMASRSLKVLTKKNPNSMAAAINAISTSVAFLRPMYCDSKPSGKRISAPAMMGMDSIKPFCAGLRLKVSEMNGAIAPLSTQMQHEKEKYKNAAPNVGA